MVHGFDKPGAKQVKQANWIRTESVHDQLAIHTLNTHLGLGESACIVLAKQLSAGLIIFDDRLARIEAETLNLPVTGTVGVLLAASKKKMLDFPTSLNELLATGFRLSEKEYERVIQL